MEAQRPQQRYTYRHPDPSVATRWNGQRSVHEPLLAFKGQLYPHDYVSEDDLQRAGLVDERTAAERLRPACGRGGRWADEAAEYEDEFGARKLYDRPTHASLTRLSGTLGDERRKERQSRKDKGRRTQLGWGTEKQYHYM